MKFIKFSLLSFLILTVISLSICYFGVEYEINKISPEIRSKMTDFDWIGIEWIRLGILIQIVAIVCLIPAIRFYVFNHRK
jgi:hypothetical protein